MSLIHYIAHIIVFFGLTGCQHPNYSEDYLIQHPHLLKDEIEYCQLLQNKTAAQVQYCEVTMNAATTLMTLLSERQQDPEKFGQKVMNIEIDYVKAKQAYEIAQQVLNANKMTSTQLQDAQIKVAETKQIYETKSRELKALLAVIGMSSPE